MQLIDDLAGTESDDISTVVFGLDCVSYEIDLTEANAPNLRESIEEYIAHARLTGGRLKRGTAACRASLTNHEQAQAIRGVGPSQRSRGV